MQDDERRDAATVFDLNNSVHGQGHRERPAESGSVKSVTLQEVQKALLLSHGEMILCGSDLKAQASADDEGGEYVDQVVEMLAELGHYDEAMEIALSWESDSSAYCLSKMIEVANRNQHQHPDLSQPNSSLIWNG